MIKVKFEIPELTYEDLVDKGEILSYINDHIEGYEATIENFSFWNGQAYVTIDQVCIAELPDVEPEKAIIIETNETGDILSILNENGIISYLIGDQIYESWQVSRL